MLVLATDYHRKMCRRCCHTRGQYEHKLHEQVRHWALILRLLKAIRPLSWKLAQRWRGSLQSPWGLEKRSNKGLHLRGRKSRGTTWLLFQGVKEH